MEGGGVREGRREGRGEGGGEARGEGRGGEGMEVSDVPPQGANCASLFAVQPRERRAKDLGSARRGLAAPPAGELMRLRAPGCASHRNYTCWPSRGPSVHIRSRIQLRPMRTVGCVAAHVGATSESPQHLQTSGQSRPTWPMHLTPNRRVRSREGPPKRDGEAGRGELTSFDAPRDHPLRRAISARPRTERAPGALGNPEVCTDIHPHPHQEWHFRERGTHSWHFFWR